MIEVIAALALLGTILVMLLMARTNSLRQWARADRKLVAVAAADALLAQWQADPKQRPRNGSGTVEGEAKLRWQTSTVPSRSAQELGGEVLRLEILDPAQPPPDRVLVQVDVVVSIRDPEAETDGNDKAR